MPYGYPNFSSSDTSKVGSRYTRFQGPVLVGSRAADGPGAQPGHIANISTAPADLIMHAGTTMTTARTEGFVYIPTASYGVSSSTAANLQASPVAAITGGAAIIFDTARKKLSVYSTVLDDWLSVTLTSS